MTMLLGPDLECIECPKKSSYDELEVETKGKKYWVCPQATLKKRWNPKNQIVNALVFD